MEKHEPAPKWSEADISLAERFLNLSHLKPGTFDEKRDAVAKALSNERQLYRAYTDLPSGVRAYISHIGAEASKKKKFDVWRAGMTTQVAAATKEWYNRFNKGKDPEHMIHPDEDDGRYLVQD